MEKKVVKMAIVGAGLWGESHANIYREHDWAEPVAICDLDLKRAEAFAEKFGITQVYSDYKEMLATDTPSWECRTNPGGVFEGFYEANILMMVLVANMAQVTAQNAKITALPIKAKGCSASPCRVVIIED